MRVMSTNDASWQPETPITVRNIWHGRVFSALPLVVVEDTAELIAAYIPPGTVWKRPTDLARYPMKDGVFDPLLFHLCLDLLQDVPHRHHAMTYQCNPLIRVLLQLFCIDFFLFHTPTLPSHDHLGK